MTQRQLGALKVTAPDVSSFALHRAALLARLDTFMADPAKRVLLLSAPAGFGKSTLLADWAARAATAPRPIAVAWCDLDGTDATSYRFWGLVLEALGQVGAPLAAAAPRRAGNAAFRDRLARHLADLDDLVLVLDNLQHVRDRQILADLDWLLDHLAPGARVVLCTRADPLLPALPRRRLQGALDQLRIGDLAFSRDEVSELCGGLEPEALDAVWRISEGWPAVVRLLAMATSAGSPGPIPQLIEGDLALADYLFAEVLESQDAETRRLLMLCSVPHALPLDLAVELTDHLDAGRALDRIAHTGLVTRFPGPEPGSSSYRFHPLLRAHLNGSLSLRDHPSALRAHAISARWFLRAGMGVEAVEHAVRSADPVVLEEVLADCGAGLITGGEADLLLSTLRSALDSAGVRTGEPSWLGPWTHTVMAAAWLDQGGVPEGLSVLSRALSLAAAPAGDLRDGRGGDALGVLVSAAEVHLRRRQGEPSPEQDLLAEPPRGTDPELRLLLAAQRGPALLWRGDWDSAERELGVGVSLARGLGRDAALIECVTFLGAVGAGRSQVTTTRQHVEEALWLARARGWDGSSRVAYTHVLAAWVAWQQLQPDTAREHMDAALAVLDVAADPTIVISARALDAALEFQADGRAEAAERLHSVWSSFLTSEAAPSLVAYAVLADVRFSLGLHRLGWIRDAVQLVSQRIPAYGEAAVVEAMVAESSGQVSRARQLLSPVAEGRVDTVVPSTRIEADVLAARLALREGDTRAAVAHARSGLELVQLLGCLRPFPDAGGVEVIALLRAERGRWGALEDTVQLILDRSGTPPRPGVQLTSREHEILCELPSLRTVEEIGATLYLSPNTIKTHLRGIYRKLSVASRREAVIEGRRLGLL